METDLKAIKDLVEFDAENIPPVMITKPQLEGIVDAWNELKDYGMSESKLYKSRSTYSTSKIADSSCSECLY